MINGKWITKGTPIFVKGYGVCEMYQDMLTISQIYIPDKKLIAVVDNADISLNWSKPEGTMNVNDIKKAIADYADTFDACAVRGSASEDNWKRYRMACTVLELNEQGYYTKAVFPKKLLGVVLAALDVAESRNRLDEAIGRMLREDIVTTH